MSSTTSELKLISSKKILDLFPESKLKAFELDEFEASGVVYIGKNEIISKENFYVVSDDNSLIAKINKADVNQNEFVETKDGLANFEGISCFKDENGNVENFVIVVELGSLYHGAILVFDSNFTKHKEHIVNFPFEKTNKGFEGITCFKSNNQKYILALCEKNEREKQIALYKIENENVELKIKQDPTTFIEIPESAKFEDYSGISIRGNKVAIVSQSTSKIWVGALSKKEGTEKDEWELSEKGKVFDFPKAKFQYNNSDELKTFKTFCNVEGVDWIDDRHIVVVSDKKKDDQCVFCTIEDQSIHLFEIPESALLSTTADN